VEPRAQAGRKKKILTAAYLYKKIAKFEFMVSFLQLKLSFKGKKKKNKSRHYGTIYGSLRRL
jgi:hypothetical protein